MYVNVFYHTLTPLNRKGTQKLWIHADKQFYCLLIHTSDYNVATTISNLVIKSFFTLNWQMYWKLSMTIQKVLLLVKKYISILSNNNMEKFWKSKTIAIFIFVATMYTVHGHSEGKRGCSIGVIRSCKQQ